jgi:hypothetical protein
MSSLRPISSLLMPSSPSALSAQEAEAQDASAQEAEAQDALAQDAPAHEALAHEAFAHEAEAQDAFAHEADAQEALAQEAEAHDAEAHDASLCATFAQLAASNAGPEPSPATTTNWFKAAFGFGGSKTAAALAASTMPTPREPRVALGVSFADTMRAPFTWSGDQSG